MSDIEKVALITGSFRGIGKAVAKGLHSVGYTVIINGVSQSRLSDSFLKKFSEGVQRVHYVQADVSKTDDREKLLQKINELGRIDILVNNAGVAPKERKDLLEATEISFDRVLSINLKGPYFLTQSVANLMIRFQKKDLLDYSPKVVNIGSISAYATSVSRGDYCLSKAGVDMMTKLYADRLAEFNIPVLEVRPGIIKTDMTTAVQEKYDILFSEGLTPISRWGTPQDVAKCVKAIALEYFPYTTGQVFNIDGGFHLKRL